MNNQTDYKKVFEKLKEIRRQPETQIKYADIWSIAHELAEAQYTPAIDYFAAGLDDHNWNWREDCIAFLGFHYPNLDEGIVKKFREMLLHDPESSVRLRAAGALGAHSKLPDQALMIALETDKNRFVREAAFVSILILAGLKGYKARKHGKNVESGAIQPNIETIQQILIEEGIDITLGLDRHRAENDAHID